MSHKDRVNAILRELTQSVFHPNYRSLFEQGADARRNFRAVMNKFESEGGW